MDKSAIYVARSDVALPLGWSLRRIDIVHSPSAAVWSWRFSKPPPFQFGVRATRSFTANCERRFAERVAIWVQIGSTQRHARGGDRPRPAILLRKFWRRRPDLNRGWRFCRPLPYHLATAPVGIGLCERVFRPRLEAATTACHSAGLWSHHLRATNGGIASGRDCTRRAERWAPERRVAERAGRGCRGPRRLKWSGKRDSNPRLRPWQGRTLPLSYSRPPTRAAAPHSGSAAVWKPQSYHSASRLSKATAASKPPCLERARLTTPRMPKDRR